MSLIEVSPTELGDARADAEALMVDECLIDRVGDGPPVLDEDTGQLVPPPRVTVYSGKCEVKRPGPPRDVLAGGGEWTLQAVIVKLPVVGSEGVRPDHRVTVVRATHDAGLAGRRLHVDGLHHSTFATSRRLWCSEVTGG